MEKASSQIRPDEAPEEGSNRMVSNFNVSRWVCCESEEGVNLTTMRINGLKSHDYHIWIERLLSVMVRDYFPDNVWRVLVELINFFRILCAKELSRTVVAEMEQLAPVILCKLEKIFPPGFFNPMQHMILHLPYEA